MDRLAELKQKYDEALRAMTDMGVQLQNLHVQDNKLFVRGAAPSEQAKNQVWTAVKHADPTLTDVMLDLRVDTTLPSPQRGTNRTASTTAPQTYTVKAGDTLGKISKELYGDANRYMTIFEANRDTLTDPDLIRPGQVLQIPAAQ